MPQVTWRADDELVRRVRDAAERQGRSMNEYVTVVLDAATNPDLADGERQRVRERLARAGLLAPPGEPRHRPPAAAVRKARREAATGTSVASLVSEGR
ncbi:MAG: transcriptional regulator [Acidimicrobiales bacterium]